jgi:hypothetical protein
MSQPREGALRSLWPTPIGQFHLAEAADVNPLLSRVLLALRGLAGEGAAASFYASEDDLLSRIDLPEWRGMVRFIVDSVQRTAAFANGEVWNQGRRSLQLNILGMWFQVSNGSADHDVHTHGNCSWSGVYYVQVDPPERRRGHPAHGARNGVTRFYGDYFNRLGGAFADLGNAYLQRCHVDIEPEEGLLVVFPSWLPHRAMAYAGERDRIVISFNVSITDASGNDRVFSYDAA